MTTSQLMNWSKGKSRRAMPRTTKMTWAQAETEAPGLLGPSKLTPYDLQVLEKIRREKAAKG